GFIDRGIITGSIHKNLTTYCILHPFSRLEKNRIGNNRHIFIEALLFFMGLSIVLELLNCSQFLKK
ncbi:hypothetical protein, partial [Bartonella sp. AA81SXKL]|uniref:hypothetical protein n=1 Tax=Bartonella sp. AA81SXKL TaxID=3243438 RepID=UPI0035D12E69